MIQSILHRSLANFKHRAGLFVFMADGSLNAKMMSVLQLVKLGRPSPEPRESFSRERDGEFTENTLAYTSSGHWYFIHFGTCLLVY